MTPLRLASVIATLTLLAWTAAASAECAWVMWSQTKERGWRAWWSSSRWELEMVYESRASCQKSVEGPQGVFTAGIRWICLPDTVDPRGGRRGSNG